MPVLKHLSRVETLGLALGFEGAILVAAIALGWVIGRSPLSLMVPSWSTAALGVAATLPVLLLFAWTQQSKLPRVAHLREEMTDLLLPFFVSCKPIDIAAISLLAGTGEELLFRGIIQTGVSELAGVGPGLAVASVIFGLVHLVTPTYALLAGLVGAYLGWLFIVSHNLLLPMIVHSVYDFAALTFLLRRYARDPSTERSSDAAGVVSSGGNSEDS